MALATHTVLIDDDRVVVNRFDFAPGDETGHHVHAMAYVIVPLTDGRLRIKDDAAGEVFADLQQGVPYSRPEGVAHNVFNDADAPLSFLEIEMKP
ncbi:MAG: quercetin dioxygenase-like cupin family protein [Paracoccaceae bacterium]|jgi:quercetin dioxygenase-like cupin family protein